MSDSTTTATGADTEERVSFSISEPPCPAVPAGKSLANRRKAGRPKGGAPPGNRNSYRHGLYSPRGPKGSRAIDRAAGTFRRHLEDCTVAAYGEISVLHASLIQTASEAARVALAEFRELCTDHDKLTATERTAKRQAALKALDLRDRKVKELGITFRPDATPEASDPFAEFDDERRLTLPGATAHTPEAGTQCDRTPQSRPQTSQGDSEHVQGNKVPPGFSEKLTSESEAAACP